MTFYLRTLGTLSLHPESPGSEPVLSESKSLIVLALLAVSPDHTLAREHVAELLWPGSGHQKARRSLRQSLYYLSQNAGGELIDADDKRLRLRTAGLDCDLWEFDRAVQASDSRAIVDEFRGRFLQSVERKLGRELTEWVELQNQRIRSARRAAFRTLIRSNLEEGRRALAVRYAREYADRNPLDEEARLYLIETLKEVGDEAGAFQAYEEYRTLVRSAVGEEPSQQLEEAIERVRQVLLDDREWKPIAASEPAPTEPARRHRGWIVGAGVALGLAIFALATAWMRGSSPDPAVANSGLATVSTTLLVKVWDQGEAGIHALRIRPHGHDLTRSDACRGEPDPRVQPTLSPDLEHAVVHKTTADGNDLHLVRCDTGEAVYRLDDRPDEIGIAWSPDGRYLLVSQGRLETDGTYTERLARLDVEARTLDTILTRNSIDPDPADWSPDGGRIAFQQGDAAGAVIRVAHADGHDPRALETGFQWSGDPAWSPDGRFLAFVAGDEGGRDLYVIPARGGQPEALTQMMGTVSSPVWISSALIAFLVERDGGRDLWLVDRFTHARRQVTRGEDVQTILFPLEGRDGRWIDRVRPDLPSVVTPGQRIRATAYAITAGGDTVAPDDRVARWSVAAGEDVVQLADGELVIRGLGEATVLFSYAGWRADTVVLRSVRLRARDLEPALVEEWSAGLDTTRWSPFGDPRPYVLSTGGPDGGGRLINNGDQNWSSGVCSRREFSTGSGLTVEAWGAVPYTGGLFQSFMIELSRGPPEEEGRRPPWLAFRQGATTKEIPEVLLANGSRFSTPRPEGPEAWHLYALQVHPDGTVDVLVDGILRWQRAGLIEPSRVPPATRVSLSGRSLGTEVSHGPVRVYEGIRHYLEAEPPPR